MVREFHVLPEDASLSDAVGLLLAGHQQDFPVVAGAGLGAPAVGVLLRADLLKALAGGTPRGPCGTSCGGPAASHIRASSSSRSSRA
jgi:hypothetical protein